MVIVKTLSSLVIIIKTIVSSLVIVLEYYIVNRGDERKWNKRTESLCSTNLKSSLLGCLVIRGSVSAEHEGYLLGGPIIPEWIIFLE